MSADTADDPHSPHVHGVIWSHMGWFLTTNGFRTQWKRIPDLARFPELRWLDRYDVLVPVVLAAALSGSAPCSVTSRPSLASLVASCSCGVFFVSTIVLFHATVTINSLAHMFGTRRFETRDESRNNFWLALITFGEGWHNNHHFFPGCARQGFAGGSWISPTTGCGCWPRSAWCTLWRQHPQKATLHGHQTFAPARRGQRSVHPAAAQPLAGSRSYRHDELSAYRNVANSERGLFQ